MALTPYSRRPTSLTDAPTHYCPGCGHGIAHKLIAEAVDKLDIRERVVGIAPVGCSILAYFYMNFDVVEAAHGRTPAVATGIKRADPEKIVFAYQGDGDLAAIGTAETIHAANRGEDIAVFFINNAVYGMTGGQMAPTTMEGQCTSTSPEGRDVETMGPPIRMCELLNTLDRPVYIERVALDGAGGVRKTRKAIHTALQNQVENKGYSFVEILSPCPTYQRLTPTKALEFVGVTMRNVFPTRVFRKNGRSPMLERILIAGSGGQGILLIGRILARAGMQCVPHVTYFPAYGAEVRGGTSNCQVVLSDEEIHSPIPDEFEAMLILNEESAQRFIPHASKQTRIIMNTSLCKPSDNRPVVEVDATDIANNLGEIRAANFVMMGAYLATAECIPVDAVTSCIRKELSGKPEALIDLNIKALEIGLNTRDTQSIHEFQT